MTEGNSIWKHGLKILGLIERLGNLGFVMDHELSVDLILQSLPNSSGNFVMNYNMNKMESTLPELINLLKEAETSIKKDAKSVMMVTSHKKKKNKKKKKPLKAPKWNEKETG